MFVPKLRMLLISLLCCLAGPTAHAQEAEAPLKDYILLGQSNMVGFGRIEPLEQLGTLQNLVLEQQRYPELLAEDGKSWAVRDDVWLVQVTVQQRQGWLQPTGRHFGPELGFGQVIGDLHDEPVLLIKASQGNRSLGWDILPPGSEEFEYDGRVYAGYGDSTPSWEKGVEKKPVDWYAGKQYDDFVRDTKEVLADLKKFYPDYDGRPVEIAGFVWWQGHKDQTPAHASRYEQNLVHLIRTLRKEFAAPAAKFVMATIAFNGWELKGPGEAVANAQLAVSGERGTYPEFADNVRTVEVRDLWRDREVSPTGQGHHYNHNAETYYEVGKRLGRGMAEMLTAKAEEETQSRPNVLLIISDDQHWSDYGFMGSEVVQTPALDQLAARGLVYTHGYVSSPLCRSSLATLATGLHTHQHGITGNDPKRGTPREAMLAKIDALETLPDLLAKAGYRSLQTGKWWEGAAARGGFSEGMTHGDPSRGGRHGDEGLKIGRQGLTIATDFIDHCSENGEPWFLWYAPFLPHTPHNPPAALLEKYAVEGVPLPVAKYRAMCEWFDQTGGELLTHLEQRGLRDDTLVILVTDNGWIQRPDRNGYAPRSKRTAYEGGVRTPVVLSWPGQIRPDRLDTPVSSVDIPSTILAACGLEVPAHWPGQDLRTPTGRPVFGAAYEHDVVDLDNPAKGLVTRYVVAGRYKLLVHEEEGRAPELYDLRVDPAEERPVEDPAIRLRLRRQLEAWWPVRARSGLIAARSTSGPNGIPPGSFVILRPQANSHGIWREEVVQGAAAQRSLAYGELQDGSFVVGPLGSDGEPTGEVKRFAVKDGDWLLESIDARAEWVQDSRGYASKAYQWENGNVIHKAMAWTDPTGTRGVLTISANMPYLQFWQRGSDGWKAEILWTHVVGGKEQRFRDFEIGDVDADSQDEIVIVTHDKGGVYVLDRSGSSWVPTLLHQWEERVFAHEVELGDLDADGVPEIYVTPAEPNRSGAISGGQLDRYRFDAELSNYERSVVAHFGPRKAEEILVTDWDRDGVDELYALVESEFGGDEDLVLRSWLDTGEGLTEGEFVKIPGRAARHLITADTDGDGRLELIASTHRSGVWRISAGKNGWESKRIVQSAFSSGFEHSMCAMDWNHDGSDELFLASDDQKCIKMALYQPEVDSYELTKVVNWSDQPFYLVWSLLPFSVED